MVEQSYHVTRMKNKSVTVGLSLDHEPKGSADRLQYSNGAGCQAKSPPLPIIGLTRGPNFEAAIPQ